MKYGILSQRNLFDGDHPLTWEEYVRLHVWAIYHRRLTDPTVPGDTESPTFDAVLRSLPIDFSAFVNRDQRDTFDLMLRMRLAGVKLPEYTEESLHLFTTLKDTKYRAEWQQIEDFEYRYFSGEKMSPNGSNYYNSGYYTPTYRVSYNTLTGINRELYLTRDPLSF